MFIVYNIFVKPKPKPNRFLLYNSSQLFTLDPFFGARLQSIPIPIHKSATRNYSNYSNLKIAKQGKTNNGILYIHYIYVPYIYMHI